MNRAFDFNMSVLGLKRDEGESGCQVQDTGEMVADAVEEDE